ncbi:hypothetical protein GJ744_008419 [Endocarpon pusillum]|uniref:Methyltransferase type 12 domain-containing protein n=1 Tax=Endocarpon pusillum TaxID=364733 RepID=A0A8H7AJ03_9EURO|nr:hypothetical protein GJ744_008419 [Endocarpon pusillum]
MSQESAPSVAPPPALPELQLVNGVSSMNLTGPTSSSASENKQDTGASSTSTPTLSPPCPSASPPPPAHRSHDPLTNSKRSAPFQFGQRYLEPDDDVFSYNAWDHVTPDAAHERYCLEQYAAQRLHPVTAYDRTRFNSQPARWWDLFYRQKSSSFFKDRHWLGQEFPVLDAVRARGAGAKVVLEVGAGAGNTAFPLVRGNENPRLRLHAVDFSSAAVRTLRASPDFDQNVMSAHVWDVAQPPPPPPPPPPEEPDDDNNSNNNNSNSVILPPGLEAGTVDVVLLIFVFSALSPAQWRQAISNIHTLLKPGGEVLFRDYGRGDLAQVRFRKGRWMEENFYVRGDGTRVYFFEADELRALWAGGGGGSNHEEGGGQQGSAGGGGGGGEGDEKEVKSSPGFEILDLDVDRRLIVNRQKKIKMYRCWIQGRFRKRLDSSSIEVVDPDQIDHQTG